jgi:metal-dependent amidase/aminoacylase/carboxypeptidase family protein
VVVSVTQIHGGDAWNVTPEQVVLRGTVRSFAPEVQDMAEANLGRIAKGVAAAHGAEAAKRYERRYPATVNSQAETRHAARRSPRRSSRPAASSTDMAPSMGSEDFAFMLQHKPGKLHLARGRRDQPNLHSPHYDFNDEILPIGASYWARLVEETLKG